MSEVPESWLRVTLQQRWQRVVLRQYVDLGQGIDRESIEKTVEFLSKLEVYRYLDRAGMIREVPIRCVGWNELTTSIEAEVLGEFDPRAIRDAHFDLEKQRRRLLEAP